MKELKEVSALGLHQMFTLSPTFRASVTTCCGDHSFVGLSRTHSPVENIYPAATHSPLLLSFLQADRSSTTTTKTPSALIHAITSFLLPLRVRRERTANRTYYSHTPFSVTTERSRVLTLCCKITFLCTSSTVSGGVCA